MADASNNQAANFLQDIEAKRERFNPESCPPDLHPIGIFVGKPNSNNHRFRVAVLCADNYPSKQMVLTAWNWWQSGGYIESIMVAIHGDTATLWGPQREDPRIWRNLPFEAVERLCIEVLRQPGPESSLRFPMQNAAMIFQCWKMIIPIDF